MKKNCQLFILLFIHACTALAQERELPVFKQVTHPFMPTITSEYFYFSEDGLMWFSTANGLTSFDGSEVVYYSSAKEVYDLSLNQVSAIAEDEAHNLYVGTYDKLIYFNRNTKKFTTLTYSFPYKNKPLEMNVQTLYIDQDKKVYIGLLARGMLIYDPVLKKFEQLVLSPATADCTDCESVPLNSVSCFAAKNKDELWLGTVNGIYSFNKKTKVFNRNFEVLNPIVNKYRKTPFYADVKKMDVADDSTIWFSSAVNGFGKYNIRTGLVKFFLTDTRLHSPDVWKAYILRRFARWQPGKYILGICDPEPGIFDTKKETLGLFRLTQNPKVFDDIQYIENDRHGNVWIMNKGMLYASMPDYYQMKQASIEQQTTPDYLPNQIGDIYFDPQTQTYFAAIVFSSGVYELDKNFKIIRIIPTPLFSNKWTYKETCTERIAKDGSGRYWTSGMQTYVLPAGGKQFEYADKLFPELSWMKSMDECLGLTATREGNILFRIADGTVYEVNHQNMHTDTIHVPEYNLQSQFSIVTTHTAHTAYDSARNKMYLNNDKYIVQYDFAKRTSTMLSYDLLFGSADRSRQEIDYCLDDAGFIWVWIPKFGIRVIDPDKLTCIDSIPNGTRGLIQGNFWYIRAGAKDFMILFGQRGVAMYNYKKHQSVILDYNNGWSSQFAYFLGYSNNNVITNERNKIIYYNLDGFSKFNFSITPLLNTINADDAVVYTRSLSNESQTINLSYQQNNLSFSFSAQEFYFPERIEYAYQLKGVDNDWHYTDYFNRKINYSKLSSGKYTFRLKAQLQGGNWNTVPVEYTIVIKPAWWQTDLFYIFLIATVIGLIVFFISNRIKNIRNKEQQKTRQEKQLLELEAKALRAQMNPHFIFNCLNSIKSLIQQHEEEKSVTYLTTFSKLIRTLFNNADKKEISLFDEIETCKLYLQLEAMRFDTKFSYEVHVDKDIDLKSVQVPALIIQPFIENAIWHGIVPKNSGGHISLAVSQNDQATKVTIDDNGIGREASLQNKSANGFAHQSKGVNLTQLRLELDNLLQQRQADMEIIDKKNENGKSTGTTVIITIQSD